MRRQLVFAVSLGVLWLCGLLILLQRASPVISSPVARTSASPGDVVINEVAWAGTMANTNHEWIELKSNKTVTVNLTNWQIRSSDGSPSITLSGEIPPGGYFLLARTNYTNVVDVPADLIYTGALVDGGEILTLTDDLDNVIDTANTNGGPWPAGTGGSGTPPRATMERVNPLAPDTDSNWASNDGVIRNGYDVNGNPINGTPKQPNSATPSDLRITKSVPGQVLVDHEITYTLMFGNAGGKNAIGVTITDTLPLSVTFITQTSPFTFTQNGQWLVWRIDVLSSYSGTLSFSVVVTPEIGLLGWITNTAVITSQVPDYRLDNNVVTATTLIRLPQADLDIHKSGPMSVTGGYELTYTIALSNTGEVDAAHVIVTDTLPPGATYVRGTEAYSLSRPLSDTLVWQLDDVAVGGPALSLTVVVTTAVDASGWLTNQVTVTTVTSETVLANNISSAVTFVTPQSADLSIRKSAPISVTAGNEITYTLAVSNVGQLDAPGVRVTDTLPVSITLIRQSAPFTFTQQGQALVWEVGDVLTSAPPVSWTVTGRVDLNLAGAVTNVVQASTTAVEMFTANNTAQAATLVIPPPTALLIHGVMYDGYQLNDTDEAIQIINVGLLPVNVQGYTVTEGTSQGVRFPTYTLQVHQRVWLAKDAQAFFDSFGFWPDFAVTTPPTAPVQLLNGSWAGLANTGGDVQIKSKAGHVLDRLVYGNQSLPPSGWSGPTLSYYSVGGETGQILARAPDERTGLPIPDTDTAADWIQSTGNYTTGRRVLYPGWDMTYPVSDMAGLFWPFTTTAPATVTLGIAPDYAFEVVRDAIRSAQRSIEIETYELLSFGVITEVVQKARAGVSVTVLLEGEPIPNVDNQELWACQEIEAAGGQCWFMHDYHPTSAYIYDRYDLIHAKLILLDRQRVIISTQNLSPGGMPDDDKADGTWGSRGYVLLIDSPELAARAEVIFDRDRAPVHADIARWPNATYGFGTPPMGYVPITVSGGATTTVRFPMPHVLTDATYLELFTAPEAALRQSDALLGLLSRAGAGDEVYVEQMYEYPDWGDPVTAPNLRLKAYLDAARRGARVRVLLNSGQFGEEYIDLARNITATNDLNVTAQQEGLDLQARMGDPTRYGIHSKLVLVKLNSAGLAYSHVSSINGSEASSKVNREIAVQIESQQLYAALSRVFWTDWHLSAPLFLPLILRDYTPPPPPADHVVVSEVLYDPSGGTDTGREWIELHNPTGSAVDISGWSLGDAVNDGEYGAGRYLFPPNTILPPGGVIVIAQQAADVAFKPNFEFLIDPNRNDPTVPDMVPAGNWSGFGLALGNTGDHVILRNAAGQPVDVVVWGNSSYPGTLPHPGVVASDHSLERRPANRDTDDCAADFVDRTPPSPGSVPQ